MQQSLLQEPTTDVWLAQMTVSPQQELLLCPETRYCALLQKSENVQGSIERLLHPLFYLFILVKDMDVQPVALELHVALTNSGQTC